MTAFMRWKDAAHVLILPLGAMLVVALLTTTFYAYSIPDARTCHLAGCSKGHWQERERRVGYLVV
jgi:hypothetical protein